MSKPKRGSASEIGRQVYWPDDTDEQIDVKRRSFEDMLFPGHQKRAFPVEVIVGRYHKPRTPEANAYLWAVCYRMMSEASGEERDTIHYAMCCKFFGEKVIDVMGEKYKRPVRTTTTNQFGEPEWLGPGEFAEFVDFVIREALFWYDVTIPPPTPKEVPRG